MNVAARKSACATFLFMCFAASTLHAATFYVTVAGLGGEPDYEQRFNMLADDLDKIVKPGGPTETLKGPAATKANIKIALEKVARESKSQDALVLMLIGHGTFDGIDYKMNLPGPDLSATELAAMLNRIPSGRQLVVNMTSASGASLNALKKENRIVVTATKTGNEKNATVFARYWVEALRDPAADTDKNETVSAMEAFRYAQQKTAKFFEEQKRLSTEHAQVAGDHAAVFPVLRMGTAAAAASDPAKKGLMAKREDLEGKIDQLKYQKALLPEDQYKKQLASLLIDLAKTQQELDK
ncbi:MAG: hypothetical protein M3Y07_12065 [Acidobacteriota bacterium]|nr:hypothetical protein [Acidobacteriota bacterium]